MNRKQTNQALQFLLALALPLVAIGAGLQSCSDDGPAIPSTDNVEKEGQVKNMLMRSPEEAIDIAQKAWEEFYGGEASASSRSGRRCVIDYGRPVEVVRGAKSRGGSGSDILLYVVNFANDGGFAVIAAPRHADELLAVTSQGHYYPFSLCGEKVTKVDMNGYVMARGMWSISTISLLAQIQTLSGRYNLRN